ncbi:hypothetical protein pgond44_14868 [Psychroflexus gondwanensis ACAM 44]|jgi:hypothetical protein|uniref:Uncharacterized protein n=1 Tax=Psychroflexus gondwanensis ACAM 44 TaxID=1189619 RepID=N1WVG6_9FLAO|nr:hypothetical protein [Psychroflexus gondwanensis]EMY79848.1 hypothetical protein pgond44_14868 [Psychroflexus gondwanensis ACAM 44]
MKNLELTQMEGLRGGALDCSTKGKLAFIAGGAIFGGIAGLGVGALLGGYGAGVMITICCDEMNN